MSPDEFVLQTSAVVAGSAASVLQDSVNWLTLPENFLIVENFKLIKVKFRFRFDFWYEYFIDFTSDCSRSRDIIIVFGVL